MSNLEFKHQKDNFYNVYFRSTHLFDIIEFADYKYTICILKDNTNCESPMSWSDNFVNETLTKGDTMYKDFLIERLYFFNIAETSKSTDTKSFFIVSDLLLYFLIDMLNNLIDENKVIK